MGYSGGIQLGSNVNLMIVTTNDTLPAVPNAAPVWTLLENSTRAVKATGQMYPDFDGGPTTTFRYPHFLGGTLSLNPGMFTYWIRYMVSVNKYNRLLRFELLPGGDTRGSVTSMASYSFGETYYLIHSTDSGQIFSGRNPSF